MTHNLYHYLFYSNRGFKTVEEEVWKLSYEKLPCLLGFWNYSTIDMPGKTC